MDYDCLKNHDRLMAVDLSQQNDLDAYLKVTLEMEFSSELIKLDYNVNATEVSADQIMFSNNFGKQLNLFKKI